jgi:aldose 1-epimerase
MGGWKILALCDGVAEATVVPEIGAALASYDLLDQAGRTALFRSCADPSHAGPFDLACNLLVPWSNRISGGGFWFRKRFHPLEPNIPGEPYPIHGNGFSSAWTVERREPATAELSFESQGPGSFRYEASVRYAIAHGNLTMRLSVRNLGAAPLPFGLGFHPWIVRCPRTILQAKAARVVLETNDHLPAGQTPTSSCPEWDFATAHALPGGWINNAFRGWDGRANILWPDRNLALDIVADPLLSTYILFSPSGNADFFCFEPVTHPVDAHNQRRGPRANGLIVLAPGQLMSVACLFRAQRLSGAAEKIGTRKRRGP